MDEQVSALDAALAPPAPNPFQVATAIGFSLPQSGQVSLKLYDLAGRAVRTLQKSPLAAGHHVRVWDGRSDTGGLAAPGVYFTRLEANGRTLSRKVVMIH